MLRGKAEAAAHKHPPDSDEGLVARLCEGQVEALGALMARHAPSLVAYCGCYLDRDGAQDAAQEAFVRVLQRCRTMKSGMRFKPWLYAIARNVCVSMLRRRRRRTEVPVEALAEAADPPDEAVADREQREAALREVDALPAKYRDVVVLHYLSGLTCEETAAALGLKTSAVKMRLRRAILRIRESLARAEILP